MADVIRTERLLLRRARADDTAAMHRLLSDPPAMRFWSTLPHESLEQTEAWMASMIDAPPAESDDLIVTRNDEVLGKLGCWKLPEIGFLFDRSAWGQGFANEALTAFIEHRRARGSTVITADTDPRNVSSIRLLQRAGFQEAGREARTFFIGGEWFDSIYWRLDLS